MAGDCIGKSPAFFRFPGLEVFYTKMRKYLNKR